MRIVSRRPRLSFTERTQLQEALRQARLAELSSIKSAAQSHEGFRDTFSAALQASLNLRSADR